ncbi:cyclic diguanylate phosphodiesterase [Xenophilus sp. AP218F]|nr:cyclic diguanylate phosphodiesterase [Chromobacterium sp. ASV5]OWY40990.1 cyclic diguanylate phosphodiesterase [Xenophilus sp. AP218F]
MNPLNSSRQHRVSHLVAAAAVAVLPMLLVGPVVVWQAQRAETRETQGEVRQTVAQLDALMDENLRVADRLLPLSGLKCASVARSLREQVAVTPSVRSTGLTRDGAMYCSSVSGADYQPLVLRSFAGGLLELMPGNRLTPDVPMLLLHRQRPDGYGALVTMDARYLQMALGVNNKDGPSCLQIGKEWLGPNLRTGQGRPPCLGPFSFHQASSRYPYTVAASLRLPSAYQVLWEEQSALTLLLIALGLAAGSGVYWLLGRPSSPVDELRRALAEDEFEPFLQPVVKPGQTAWAGAEVLMRWRHPREGLIRPDLFIPRAEESGLIVPMTRQMMRKVAQGLAREKLPPGFHLGFNISTAHFRDCDLYQECAEFLAAFPPGALSLTVELTERELLQVTPDIENLFQRLDKLGVKIALDDFGTGHSSLVYLQKLAVDGLKIDQSFVARIGTDSLSGHIVDSVVELAAKLGLETVAEGVETQAQYDYLTRLGVGWLQGYLIAKPMPLKAFVQGLRDSQRPSPPPLASPTA